MRGTESPLQKMPKRGETSDVTLSNSSLTRQSRRRKNGVALLRQGPEPREHGREPEAAAASRASAAGVPGVPWSAPTSAVPADGLSSRVVLSCSVLRAFFKVCFSASAGSQHSSCPQRAVWRPRHAQPHPAWTALLAHKTPAAPYDRDKEEARGGPAPFLTPPRASGHQGLTTAR